MAYDRAMTMIAHAGWGYPARIQIDQGMNLISADFADQFRSNGTTVLDGTPYRDDNSLAEIANRLLHAALRPSLDPDMRNWASRLPEVEIRINDMLSLHLGASPNQTATGADARLPIDNMLLKYEDFPDLVRRELVDLGTPWRTHYEQLVNYNRWLEKKLNKNADAETHKFEPGQKVLVNTKFRPDDMIQALRPKDKWKKRWSGPFVVLAENDEVHYTIEVLDKRGIRKPVKFHATCLKRWVEDDSERFPGRDNVDKTLPENWLHGMQFDKILECKRLAQGELYKVRLSNMLLGDKSLHMEMWLRGMDIPRRTLADWKAAPAEQPLR